MQVSSGLGAGPYRSRAHSREAGFTLVELVISVGLTAFVFAALASLLGHSLRVLSISKARTQGNEVATQGMEELQRLSYAALGVCLAATSPPAGFADTAKPNCPPGTVGVTYGEDPCNTTTAGAGTPKSIYTCSRAGITYDVRRYVAWGDASHASKRMAVLVTWRDAQGLHEISQQSSVRAPTQGDIYGLDPPRITSVDVPSSVIMILPDGTLVTDFTVRAVTTNLVSTDRVFAVFTTLDADGNSQTSSKALGQTTVNNWQVTIQPTDGFRFPVGSQFVSIGAVRGDDGKANSAFAPTANKFCTPTDSSCSSAVLPSFTSQDAVSSDGGTANVIKVDAGGSLVPSSIVLTAVTRNLVETDTVSVSFETSAGAVTVQLIRDPTPPCDLSACTWTGRVNRDSGYGFPLGTRKFYFAATATGGSTAAAETVGKTFQL